MRRYIFILMCVVCPFHCVTNTLHLVSEVGKICRSHKLFFRTEIESMRRCSSNWSLLLATAAPTTTPNVVN